MRKIMLTLLATTVVTVTSAQAEVNVNVNIGLPAPRVVVHGPPTVVFETAPLFLAPPRLGFYIGADTPYDIVFASDMFYLYYGNSWYRSSNYSGPWAEVHYDNLPPVIRKHRIERIRLYRDDEFRRYRHDRDQYRGQHFRGDRREWKEERKEERRHEQREWKEEKRDRKHRGRDND